MGVVVSAEPSQHVIFLLSGGAVSCQLLLSVTMTFALRRRWQTKCIEETNKITRRSIINQQGHGVPARTHREQYHPTHLSHSCFCSNPRLRQGLDFHKKMASYIGIKPLSWLPTRFASSTMKQSSTVSYVLSSEKETSTVPKTLLRLPRPLSQVSKSKISQSTT